MKKSGFSELIHNGKIYDKVNTFDFDLDFYVNQCKKVSGKILELCCGTGRLTIPISASGADITGVDIEESMLAEARRKNEESGTSVKFIKEDIRNLQLGEKYDLIFIPFNSLQCFYSIDEIEEVFNSVKKHLKEDGIFIFDIFNPSIELMVERKNKWSYVNEFTTDDGKKIIIEEKCSYDSENQINHVTWKHIIDGEERLEYLNMRCFYPLEMDALVKYNNFEIINKFGDFESSLFNNDSMKQIYVCKLTKLK